MAWLINQRARLKGILEKHEKLLRQLPQQIAITKEELRAIDAVIPLHEVSVEPTAIVGKKPKRKNTLPRGTMMRHILNYLRSEKVPLYTDDIALHIAKLENIDLETFPRTKFTRLISYRMKGLASQGIVVRHHCEQTSKMGRWSLRSD